MNRSSREIQIVAAIVAANKDLPSHVLIPPGDDMAMIDFGSSRMLVAVDQVVEGVHFITGTSMDLIARKAVARNISDVAAMAGLPIATLACATLPREMSQDIEAELLSAVRRWTAAWGAPLIGGDTTIHRTSSAPLVLSITVMARPRSDGRVLTRSGAKVGDILVVSGSLGGSFHSDGTGRHLTFSPRVEEAHDLVDRLGMSVHAMIDLSDGLGLDCARVIRASSAHCGCTLQARLDAGSIPCNAGVSIKRALHDGEDYELLAAIDPSAPVPTGFISVGKVVEKKVVGSPAVVLVTGDQEEDVSECGWTHE